MFGTIGALMSFEERFLLRVLHATAEREPSRGTRWLKEHSEEQRTQRRRDSLQPLLLGR